jgi:hypothetical protein
VDPRLEGRRRALVDGAACELEAAALCRYDRASGALAATDLGRTASHYYVSVATVRVYNDGISSLDVTSITKENGSSWLSVSPTVFSVSATQQQPLSVDVAPVGRPRPHGLVERELPAGQDHSSVERRQRQAGVLRLTAGARPQPGGEGGDHALAAGQPQHPRAQPQAGRDRQRQHRAEEGSDRGVPASRRDTPSPFPRACPERSEGERGGVRVRALAAHPHPAPLDLGADLSL